MVEPSTKRRKLSHTYLEPVIIFNIIKYLNVLDLLTSSLLVNKQWNDVGTSNLLWTTILSNEIELKYSKFTCDDQYLYRCGHDLKVHIVNRICFEKWMDSAQMDCDTTVMKRAIQHLNNCIYFANMKTDEPNVAFKFHSSLGDCTIDSSTVDIRKLPACVVFGASRLITTTHEGGGILDEDHPFVHHHYLINFTVYNPHALSAVSFNVEQILADENDSETTLVERYRVLSVFHNPSGDESSTIESLSLFDFVTTNERTLCQSELLLTIGNRTPLILSMNREVIERASTLLGICHWKSFIKFILGCINKHFMLNDYYNDGKHNMFELRRRLEFQIQKKQLSIDFTNGKQLFYQQDSASIWMDRSFDSEEYIELMSLVDNIVDIRHNDNSTAGFFCHKFPLFNLDLNTVVTLKSLTSSKTYDLELRSNGYGRPDGSIPEWDGTITLNGYIAFIEDCGMFVTALQPERPLIALGCSHLSVLDFYDFVFACLGIAQWLNRQQGTTTTKYCFQFDPFKNCLFRQETR